MFAKPVMGGITSHYGWRTLRDRYGREYRNFHNGTDFGWLNADIAGSRKVYSAHPGTVVDAAYSSAPGNYVLVDIGNGYKLRYIHLASIAVEVGQKVGYSTFIGGMGDTGTATSPGQVHLHLDLYKGAERVNLESFLTLPFGYTGPTLTSGDTTPIESEEDDMFTDEDRKALRPIRELIQTPDGTVWYCFERVIRYGIPSGENLATYQAHLRALGYDDAIVSKNARDIRAYGTPVFVDPLGQISAAVDAVVSDEEIQAAIAAGGVGGSEPVDLAPVMEALRRLPSDTIEALKNAL